MSWPIWSWPPAVPAWALASWPCAEAALAVLLLAALALAALAAFFPPGAPLAAAALLARVTLPAAVRNHQLLGLSHQLSPGRGRLTSGSGLALLGGADQNLSCAAADDPDPVLGGFSGGQRGHVAGAGGEEEEDASQVLHGD